MSETDPADSSLTDRVERLETGQASIIGKLDELLSGVHGKATERTEAKLDRPSTVEEQVRMELERKDREAKAAAEKDAEKTERQTLAQRLAKLEEQAPRPPQPRRQRIMWGERER